MSHITQIISHIFGNSANIQLPEPLASLSVKAFAKMYNINLDEAEKPLKAYHSIGELFTRELKENARPLGEGLLSPVDGTLRNFGNIDDISLEQIKGRHYTLDKLLIKEKYVEMFRSGIFFNLYLSPHNYHHIHAPLDCDIVDVIHVPGHLWPVNTFTLNHKNGVFTANERKIIILNCKIGTIALIMVAALNVGGISLRYEDGTLKSFYAAGEELGTFKLGSTVILLLPKDSVVPLNLDNGQAVQFGQTLASL